MPRLRSNARIAPVKLLKPAAGRAVSCGGGAPTSLGKRSSGALQSANPPPEEDIVIEQHQLEKKFRNNLHIGSDQFRSTRRLKNITNTVDQQQQKQQTAVKLAGNKREAAAEAESAEQLQNGERLLSETKRAKQEDVSAIVDGENKLRLVLGRHYFDVANRINLKHVPSCVTKVARCAEQHAKRTNQARKVSQRILQDTREMLVENRPMHFLEYIEQALLRNEFIGGQLFAKALELILTINEPSDQLNAGYSVQSVLHHTVDILDRTVDNFPPCWLDLKLAYQRVILATLEEECFQKYDRSEGLLKVVLFLLEQSVESKDISNDVSSLGRTLSNTERSMANFHLWEQEYGQKYDFDVLVRNDKLERIFLVLQLLVKVLEYDLAMWILRHPHNAKENMTNTNRMPLIAGLLWNENSTVGEVNSLIKRIIALYVNVNAVHYPKEAIETLSRFLSVIGTAINLTEIQYDGSVVYPCIKQNTRYFAQQIMRHLEASGYYSVPLCLRAIEQMRSPLLRMLMAEYLLQKLTPLPVNIPSAASYLKQLANGQWKAFRPDNPPEADIPTSTSKFPFLDHRKQKRAAQEIGQPQYVNLLLVAFQAYMQVFPLKTYFKDLKPPNLEPVDLPAKKRAVKVEKLPAMVLEEISVTPSLLLHYRDEVKHLLLMQRWLRTKAGASTEEREMFAPWRKYLISIDKTLICD